MQKQGCGKSNNNNNGQQVVFETNAWVEPILLFGNIYQPKPSAIQGRAVLPIINGYDVVAHAQSGTGKSFKISDVACETVDTSITMVHVMFLSPMRELVSQTEQVILAIGNYKNIQESAGVGGKSVGEDIRKLEYEVHVVSGTHGRVCDMVKRTLWTRAIKLPDESDEMLTRGFKDQIYDVYKYLPPELQVVLICGILPIEIVNIMTDPIRMLVKREESTLEEIKQLFFAGEKEEWKTGALYYHPHTLIIIQAIIFCSTSQMDGTWLWLSAKLLPQVYNKDTVDLLVQGNDVSNRCETSEVPLFVDVLWAAASAALKNLGE